MQTTDLFKKKLYKNTKKRGWTEMNTWEDVYKRQEVKAADKAKIGVLVADVSGEEAQGFRSYYENYIAGNYDVEFNYTDALQSAEDEKTAIEKFASQGCQAIISFSSNDRVQQLETCEKYGVYYAVASGVLDDAQYETCLLYTSRCV